MRKLDLNDIKQYELSILKSFDEFCAQNNLDYSLCGGTLLGAVRHRGFIPWDDDIDVMMPRKDYDRLLYMRDVSLEGFPDYLVFASWHNKLINYPFIKLLDKRITIDSKYHESNDQKMNNLWIDILPVDNIPNDQKIVARLFNKAGLMRKIICVKFAKVGEGKTKIKALLKPIAKIIFKPFSIYKLDKRLDDISKAYKHKKTNRVGIVLWGLYGLGECIDRKGFYKKIDLEFEGHKFKAISNYKEYLSGIYGDYMTLPPEDKRTTHDMVAYINDEV